MRGSHLSDQENRFAMKGSKTVVLGLDGAPYSLVKRFVAEGVMPHLSGLIKNGAFSPLESSFHPVSPIAWTGLLSGVNPGVHNIFDWGYRCADSYRIGAVNATRKRAPMLWDILAVHQKTCGIFNVPVTYPPSPVQGFMVSGFDTPGLDSVFTFPGELAGELKSAVGDYRLTCQAPCVPSKEREYTDALVQELRKKKEAMLFLIDKYDVDLYWFACMETDHLLHKLWRLVGTERECLIREVYHCADELIGEVVQRFPPEANIIIVSDHGAGPLEGVMYVNNWLQRIGMLTLKHTLSMRIKKWLEKSDGIARLYFFLSKLGAGSIFSRLPARLKDKAAMSFVSFDDIDWARTKAYSFGAYGQIYVNLRGREPGGIVSEGNEYDEVVASLIEGLNTLKNGKGEKMITAALRSSELYQGPFCAQGPDILFEVRSLGYDSSTKFGFSADSVFGEPEFRDSGTHRREGILIARGPRIRQGVSSEKASIVDIVPTVLSVMGLSVPAYIEGRLIEQIVTKDVICKTMGSAQALRIANRYPCSETVSQREQDSIKERLKSLGYLG
jgi:predicted AlkP superfamily phosphohydrolase/phosphomutase